MDDKIQYDVPAVETAINILEFLSRFKNKKSTLTEIYEKLHINKSTCLRILRTLRKHQFVYYDEITKQYSLGVSLVVLGNRASSFSDTLEIIKPNVHHLMLNTQLTTVLAQQKSKDRLIYLLKEEPENAIRVHVNVGQHFPIYPSAFGKCLLAYMDEKKSEIIIKERLKELRGKKYTPKTITDIMLLKEDFRSIREKGYSVSHEELFLGVTGIASPIFDMHGTITLIIVCLGISAYLDEEKIAIHGETIRNAAIHMTKELGGKLPDTLLRFKAK